MSRPLTGSPTLCSGLLPRGVAGDEVMLCSEAWSAESVSEPGSPLLPRWSAPRPDGGEAAWLLSFRLRRRLRIPAAQRACLLMSNFWQCSRIEMHHHQQNLQRRRIPLLLLGVPVRGMAGVLEEASGSPSRSGACREPFCTAT